MRGLLVLLAAGAAVLVFGVAGGRATSPDFSTQWGGGTGDVPLVGDIDGDGIADIAYWHPSDGMWHILKSTNGYNHASAFASQWGQTGDLPFLADLDQDGTADLVIYRPSTTTFYVKESSLGFSGTTAMTISWPLLASYSNIKFQFADIDGDGHADIVAFIPDATTGSTGLSQWLVLGSKTGFNPTFASYINWGISTDIPLVGKTSTTAKADLVAYRQSSGSWYPVNSSYGLPIQRIEQAPSSGSYNYAPDIIKHGTNLYAFTCSAPTSGGTDNIAVAKSTDGGSTWTTPSVILWPASAATVDPTIGAGTYPANDSFCDPSVVDYGGYYYLYNTNDFNTGTGGAEHWIGYITVSRLPDTSALDSSASSWTTYTRSGTWVNEPTNPQGVVFPKTIRTSSPYGYGAGEQSVAVVSGHLVMFYVDDSQSPVDFDPSIDNCWAISTMTSTDPVSWDWAHSTSTNACGHSPVVKYDDSRSRWVLVWLDNCCNASSRIVAEYSTDGATGAAFTTSPTEILSQYLLPHKGHNLGVEGDEYGHFVSGETPLVAWADQGNFLFNTSTDPNAFWLPWDLYGARLDVQSGSPGASSATYTLGGSTGATPLMGDIDGDGKDDLVIFDPSALHTWSIAESSNSYGTPTAVADFGSTGTPFLAHFNPGTASGDADLVLYDSSTGDWSVAYAANAVH